MGCAHQGPGILKTVSAFCPPATAQPLAKGNFQSERRLKINCAFLMKENLRRPHWRVAVKRRLVKGRAVCALG